MKESRDKQVKDLCDRLNEEHYAELQQWKERLRDTERALKAKDEELLMVLTERKKRSTAIETTVQTDSEVEIVQSTTAALDHGTGESKGLGRSEAVGVQTDED